MVRTLEQPSADTPPSGANPEERKGEKNQRKGKHGCLDRMWLADSWNRAHSGNQISGIHSN